MKKIINVKNYQIVQLENCKIYHSESKNKNICVRKNKIKTFEGSNINPLILKGKNNKIIN